MSKNITKVAILYYGQGDTKDPLWESCCELIGPESLLKVHRVNQIRCQHGGEIKETHLVLVPTGPQHPLKTLEEFDVCPMCGDFPVLWGAKAAYRKCGECGLSIEFAGGGP